MSCLSNSVLCRLLISATGSTLLFKLVDGNVMCNDDELCLLFLDFLLNFCRISHFLSKSILTFLTEIVWRKARNVCHSVLCALNIFTKIVFCARQKILSD